MANANHAGQDFFLGDASFKSEAKGVADVARSLAGRARVLYELATGTNPFPSEPFASTKNPQGEHGHDHSGPPWGSAFLHPIAWVSGKKDSAGNIQQADNSQPGVGITAGQPPCVIGPWVIWNRPHSKVPAPKFSTANNLAPYDRGYLRGTAHRTGSGTVELDVALVTLDISGHELARMSSTSVTLASTSEVAFTVDDAWLILRQGRNIVRIEFSSPSAAAGIIVDSLTICQTVKRSH